MLGDENGKPGAVGSGGEEDGSTCLEGEALHDTEAEPCAFAKGLGGELFIERFLKYGFGHPRAVVADADGEHPL